MASASLNNTNMWPIISRTLTWVRDGRSQKAIDHLSSSLIGGLPADLALQCAQILCAVGRAPEAVRLLQQTRTKQQPHPTYPVLAAIGFAHLDAQQTTDSLKVFDAALATARHLRRDQINYKEQAMLMLGRTMSLVRLGQIPVARDMLDRHSAKYDYAICPAFKIAQATVNSRIAVSVGIENFQDIIDVKNGDPWLKHRATHELATCYEAMQNWSGARDAFRGCLAFIPEDPKAKTGLARIEAQLVS